MSQQQQQHQACRLQQQQVDCNGGGGGGFVLTWRPQPPAREQFSYDMGRDSPGALLDMLAEVASQTLHSEKKLELDTKPVKQKETKRKSQQVSFSINQLLTMPATQLVKLFTVFSSDELKRQYTYACALVPGCGQNYTSFASEGRARMSIKSHLAEHLEFLKNNAEAYASFTATAVKYAKPKTIVQNKKPKVQQTKKPHKETLNKENKETKVGKSTNHLRKILSNEANLKEFENIPAQEEVIDCREPDAYEKKESDVRVLKDHSYHERVKDETVNEESSSNISRIPVNSLTKDNIMLMVVQNNSVFVKEPPADEKETIKFSNEESQEVENMTLWKEDMYTASDSFVPAKPKGKAKFIGTSKEEREMALALIDKIRKKGNPTGNNLQCRICDPPRSFTAPTTLVSHYRSHAGIKPYECRICRSVFTRRHSLKYHMLIHQNQTRFTCADCGKKFRHPSHFREHRRRHTGEAPFGCEDCGQRFKTRNTYKRHLKTRHGKVLTITGELLHLSEEDSKKVRTKNRRKKPDNLESTINEVATATESSEEQPQDQDFTWEEQQMNNTTESAVQSIENSLWMFENGQSAIATEDNFIDEKKAVNHVKTEFDETEVESNFENSEVVIAQTDSNGALHFENYQYPSDAVFTDSNGIEYSCEESVTGLPEEEKEYENTETIVEFQECTEEIANDYTEEINSVDTPDEAKSANVLVLNNEEIITPEIVETSDLSELLSTPNTASTEEASQVSANPENRPVKIIPCQIKVCDSNGGFQVLKNLAVIGNSQGINLMKNGKQQTLLLLASGDNINNIKLEMDNSSIIEGSKSVPVIAVPAE